MTTRRGFLKWLGLAPAAPMAVAAANRVAEHFPKELPAPEPAYAETEYETEVGTLGAVEEFAFTSGAIETTHFTWKPWPPR